MGFLVRSFLDLGFLLPYFLTPNEGERRKLRKILVIWKLGVLLADCIQMFRFTLVQEAFNMTTIGMNNCDRINMHTEYIEEYVLIFFFFFNAV